MLWKTHRNTVQHQPKSPRRRRSMHRGFVLRRWQHGGRQWQRSGDFSASGCSDSNSAIYCLCKQKVHSDAIFFGCFQYKILILYIFYITYITYKILVKWFQCVHQYFFNFNNTMIILITVIILVTIIMIWNFHTTSSLVNAITVHTLQFLFSTLSWDRLLYSSNFVK